MLYIYIYVYIYIYYSNCKENIRNKLKISKKISFFWEGPLNNARL